MKFIKFTVVYLLLFVSYLSYRFSQLEPNHLHAIAEALGAVGGILIACISVLLKSSEHQSNEEEEVGE